MSVRKNFGRSKKKVKARWIVLTSVVLLLALSISFAWAYLQSKLDKINYVDASSGSGVQWKNLDGTIIDNIADLEYLNVLLLGTDERSPEGTTEDFSPDLLEGARADACMILSLNLKEHTAKLVSLERAIGVKIEGYGEDWLTHVFAYGGAELMLKTVQERFDIDVQRYARVNVSAAAELIDAIGGVDIELTKTEADALNGKINTNSTTRHKVYEGLNHLDGFDAVAYGRQRLIDSDFGRVKRQRNVLQAAANQAKSLNLFELNNLLDVALPLIETNFTKDEINALLPSAVGFLGVKFDQMTLPIKGTYGNKLTDDGRSMMMVDVEEGNRILHDFLYDDFDPDTYTVPAEVTKRIQKAAKEADTKWTATHSSGSTTSTSSAASSSDPPEVGVVDEDSDTEENS